MRIISKGLGLSERPGDDSLKVQNWAQTEENNVQSRMFPTQRGQRMSQGLRGVRGEQQGKGSRNGSLLCSTS